jgi:prephenate dehydratase
MDSHSKLSNGDEEDAPIPIVSFLGPVSSYTHQVLTLAQIDRPAWSIGLTDFDLAQAALASFEADQYDYRPEITITGTNQRCELDVAI